MANTFAFTLSFFQPPAARPSLPPLPLRLSFSHSFPFGLMLSLSCCLCASRNYNNNNKETKSTHSRANNFCFLFLAFFLYTHTHKLTHTLTYTRAYLILKQIRFFSSATAADLLLFPLSLSALSCLTRSGDPLSLSFSLWQLLCISPICRHVVAVVVAVVIVILCWSFYAIFS